MSLATLSFLVADASPASVRSLAAILRGFGVPHLHTAGSVAESLDILRARRIDLAFVDMDLDGVGEGLRLLRLVRSARDSRDPHLPVLVLSTLAGRPRVEAARDAGAHDFLAKPCSPAQVFRRLGAVIERPRPFVRAAAFHGPDRRRRADAAYTGPERRLAEAGPPGLARAG